MPKTKSRVKKVKALVEDIPEIKEVSIAAPSIASSEKPIIISIDVNNETYVIKTDNILQSLRDLKIDPRIVKTVSRFTLSFNGSTPVVRIFNVQRMKRLLINPMVKLAIAKQFTNSLAAPKSNYE